MPKQKFRGSRFVGILIAMLAWLAIMLSIVLSRAASSPLGGTADTLIGVVTVTLVFAVVAVVLCRLSRPNVARSLYLRERYPNGVVLTIRRTAALLGEIEELTGKPPSDHGVSIGLWLSFVADSAHAAIWAGRDVPEEVLRVDRQSIVSISRVPAFDGPVPLAGIEIRVHDPKHTMAFTIVPSSELLAGMYPVVSRTADRIREDISGALGPA